MSSVFDRDGARRPLAAVTGASGFIGSHLVDALLGDGYAVRCLVRETSPTTWLRREAEQVYGDLNNINDCRTLIRGATLIFHLGGAGARRLAAEPEVNAGGTANLARAWQESGHGAHVIYLSTVKVSRLERWRARQAPTAAQDPYANGKLLGEAAIHAAGLAAPARAMIVRAPLIYGPRDQNLIGVFRMARRGLLPRITGHALAPFGQMHVNDLVRYLIAQSAREGPGVAIKEVESVQQTDWNDMAQAIHACYHGTLIRAKVPVALLHAVRRIGDTVANSPTRTSMPPHARLVDLLDGGLAFSGPAVDRIDGLRLRAGVAATATWYRCSGWA